MEGRETVFLLADGQVAQEAFLEDVNSILNAGAARGGAARAARAAARRGARALRAPGGVCSLKTVPVQRGVEARSQKRRAGTRARARARPGDVPNLMGPDEVERIAAAMRPLMAAAGAPHADKAAAYAFFVERCARFARCGVRTCVLPVHARSLQIWP